MKKNNITQNRGITLIALIITIIVILILVAVSITMAVNGGLFSYAGRAKAEQEIAQYKETLEQARVEAQMKTYIENVDLLTSARTIVSNYSLFADATIEEIENNQFIVITKEGYRFVITENGVQYLGISILTGTNGDETQANTKVSLKVAHVNSTTGVNLIEEVEQEYNIGTIVVLSSESINGYKIETVVMKSTDTETVAVGGPVSFNFEINKDSEITFKYKELSQAEITSEQSKEYTPKLSVTTSSGISIKTEQIAKNSDDYTSIPETLKTGDEDVIEDIEPLTPVNGEITVLIDLSDTAEIGDEVSVYHRRNNGTWEQVGNTAYIVDNNYKITITVSNFSPFYFSIKHLNSLAGTVWFMNEKIGDYSSFGNFDFDNQTGWDEFSEGTYLTTPSYLHDTDYWLPIERTNKI